MARTPGDTDLDRLERALGADGEPADAGATGPDRPIEWRIDLHHAHLPTLEDAAVIVHDEDRGVVRRGRSFDELHSLLRVVDDHRGEPSDETD